MSAAQDLLGVIPDLTAFGKIVGGGLPIGGYGGRQDIMRQYLQDLHIKLVQWLVTRYLCKAGIALLEVLEQDGVY